MNQQPAPTFEEWSDYCFTRGYADFHRRSDELHSAANDRLRRFIALSPTPLAEYLVRLFENAMELRTKYTPDQIGEATRFIFGRAMASEYFCIVRSPATPRDLQVRCYDSVLT